MRGSCFYSQRKEKDALNILKNIYYWVHRMTSQREERGAWSAGLWPNKVRQCAILLARKNKGILLDVGCGEGLFLRALAAEGQYNQIYGLDRNDLLFQQAQECMAQLRYSQVKLVYGDAVSLPFDNDFFDTVTCINVTLNLPSLTVMKQVFSEMARVCKKGGKVIFDIRNSANPFLSIKYKLAPYYDGTLRKGALHAYNRKEWPLFLDNTGLAIKKEIPIGFPRWLPPIIMVEAEKV